MNKKIIFSLLSVASLFFTVSCKTKVVPISSRIAKVWSASSVKENNVEVYKTGAVTNTKPGYLNYKLDLSTPPNVTIKEVDGGTYVGKYTVTDTKITITGLTPEPTGTSGSLSFTITSFTETELILTADQDYAKTGGKRNIYTLITSK